MNTSKTLLLHCIAIGIITQVVFVRADYLVSVRIQDFTTICRNCGTYFRYCIQSLNGAEQCLESHQHVQPGIVLDFSQEYLLLRENPLIFRGPTKEWEGANIYLAVLDRNSRQGDNLLIDVRVNLTIANTQLGIETANFTFIGPMGNSNITASFLVRCAEYWYGGDCYTWCQNNCMCDLPVTCHDDCLGVICGENRHCVDGVDVYVCTCDDGFTGPERRCEVNINECEGVNCSGNGRCIDGVDSFDCDCDSGYLGTLCEISTVREKTLPYLITAITGWGLLITLTLILITAIIFTKWKNRHSNKNASTAGATILQSGPLASPFINDCTQENVSYRAIPPEGRRNICVQMPSGISATTRVNISHRGRDSSLYYENSSEVLYEDIA